MYPLADDDPAGDNRNHSVHSSMRDDSDTGSHEGSQGSGRGVSFYDGGNGNGKTYERRMSRADMLLAKKDRAVVSAGLWAYIPNYFPEHDAPPQQEKFLARLGKVMTIVYIVLMVFGSLVIALYFSLNLSNATLFVYNPTPAQVQQLRDQNYEPACFCKNPSVPGSKFISETHTTSGLCTWYQSIDCDAYVTLHETINTIYNRNTGVNVATPSTDYVANKIKICEHIQTLCSVSLNSYMAVFEGVLANATFYSYTLPTAEALQNDMASRFQAGFQSVLVSFAAADNNQKAWADANLAQLLTALVNAGQFAHPGAGAMTTQCVDICGSYHVGNGVCDSAVFQANGAVEAFCVGPPCAFELNDCWNAATFNASNFGTYGQPDVPSAQIYGFLQNEITSYWTRWVFGLQAVLVHNIIGDKNVIYDFIAGKLPQENFLHGGKYAAKCNCIEDWSCAEPVQATKPFFFDDTEPVETLFYADQATGPSSRFYSYRQIVSKLAISIPLIQACDGQLAQELEPLGQHRQALLLNPDKATMYASIDSVVANLRARNPDPVPSSCVFTNGSQGLQAGAGIICELGVSATDLTQALRNEADRDLAARQTRYSSFGEAKLGLFLDNYTIVTSFDKFFSACSVSFCSYTSQSIPDSLTTGTVILGIIGGLQTGLSSLLMGIANMIRTRMVWKVVRRASIVEMAASKALMEELRLANLRAAAALVDTENGEAVRPGY